MIIKWIAQINFRKQFCKISRIFQNIWCTQHDVFELILILQGAPLLWTTSLPPVTPTSSTTRWHMLCYFRRACSIMCYLLVCLTGCSHMTRLKECPSCFWRWEIFISHCGEKFFALLKIRELILQLNFVIQSMLSELTWIFMYKI